MALNTSKCNYLTPLHFKGLSYLCIGNLQGSKGIVSSGSKEAVIPAVLVVTSIRNMSRH